MTKNKKWLAVGAVALILIVGGAIALNQGKLLSGNLTYIQLPTNVTKINQNAINSLQNMTTTPAISCTTNPSPAYTTEPTTWTATLLNVPDSKGLTFTWSGNGITGSKTANSVKITYPEIDANAIVNVTAKYWEGNEDESLGGHVLTKTCSAPLKPESAKPQPAAALGSFCNASNNTPAAGDTVTLTGTVTGGKAPYAYSWTGADVSSTTQTLQVPLKDSDVGTKTITFKVSDDANQNSSADCTLQVKQAAAPAQTLAASCTPSTPTPGTGLPITLTGAATGGTAPYQYAWDGAEVSGKTDAVLNVTYNANDVGAQTANLTVTDANNATATAQCAVTIHTIFYRPPTPMTPPNIMTPQQMQPAPSTTSSTSTSSQTTQTSSGYSCTGFSDINSNDVDCSAIGYVKSIGAITGNPDGSFNPGGLIQRDQIAKIALQTFKLIDPNGAYCSGGSTGFPDVTLNDWSYQYVCRAKGLGVITGYLSGPDTGFFRPSRNLNRAEFLAIILRNLSGQMNNGTSYSDVSLNDWFSAYASFAYNNGLYTGSMLYPEQAVTRREATEVIYKLHQLGKI